MVDSSISSKRKDIPHASSTAETAVSKKESVKTAAQLSSKRAQNSANASSKRFLKSEKPEKSESSSTTETMMNETQYGTSIEQSSPTPKRLVWREIYAEVVPEKTFSSRWSKRANDPPRIVLNSVSGYAEPGQITFLMGSSGAGKTTLLNILTQQQKGLKVYGEVAVNKHVMELGEMRRLSAYVQQEDLFIGELTVKETLKFNAYLRMPSSCTGKERLERVDQVSTEMGLEPCLGTKIGSIHEKSISKGEKKRLAFACELLTNPRILFCDEPTSGLDSFMALQVIRALKALANEGKTIICSIHQPSSQVYELADRLVLMGAGRVAYQGPANYVGQYFTSISYPCPQFVSVSDHFLTVLSHNPEKEALEDYNKRIETILDSYNNTSLAKETHQITHEQLTSSRRKRKEPDEKPEYAASWCTQFYWLLWRAMKCVLRHPMILRVRLFQSFLVAILIGMMNFQLEPKKNAIMNFREVAYCSLRDMNIMFMFPCIQVFTAEMHIARREYHASMYCPSAYFMGRNVADSLQYLVFPFVYATIVYWMAGFQLNFGQYAVFWMVTTIMAITSRFCHVLPHYPFNSYPISSHFFRHYLQFEIHRIASVGYAAACLLGNLTLANTYLPLFTVPMLVFVQFPPVYFNWLSYFSWYRYAFETNIYNIFSYVGNITGCENVTAPYELLEASTSSYLTSTMPYNETVNTEIVKECLGSNGTEVLAYHRMSNNNNWEIWSRMLIMLGLIVAWRIIAMVALHFRMRRN